MGGRDSFGRIVHDARPNRGDRRRVADPRVGRSVDPFRAAGSRILRDWTVGTQPRLHENDGYDSDHRRIGLTEYEGDITGTFISWGFGGVKTDWSALAIAAVAAAPLGLLAVLGATTLLAGARRRCPTAQAKE